jgi:hypothetical protein
VTFPDALAVDENDDGLYNGGDIKASVEGVALASWNGSLDPVTGASTIQGYLRVKLENLDSGLGSLTGSCYVGGSTTSAAIPLAMTTASIAANGSMPSLTGVPYSEEDGKVTLVNNTLNAPGASGCGLLGLGNGQVNDALGLPSTNGNNRAELQFQFDPAPLALIYPRLTVEPTRGRAPLPVQFDATGSAARAGYEISEYAWDFDGDGQVDETTTEPSVEHVYGTPGEYDAKLTIKADQDEKPQVSERITHHVTVTGVNAKIETAPPALTNSQSASFTFSSTDADSFECKLDNGPFTACDNPQEYEDLAQGVHTFAVRGVDEIGPGLPVTYQWRIDLTKPVATFINKPPARTNSLTAFDLTFTGTDNVSAVNDLRFECKFSGDVDDEEPGDDEDAFGDLSAPFSADASDGWKPCESPRHVEWELVEGEHTFQVRAIDEAGNVGLETVTTWVVDLTPPSTTLTGQPMNTLTNTPASLSNPTNQGSGTTNNANSQFTFTSDEPGGTFVCKFNNAAERSDCVSPMYTGTGNQQTNPNRARLGNPVQGENTFTVWAVDAAGNRDPNGVTFKYTFDNVVPQVNLQSGFLPPVRTNQTSFNVLATTNEPIATKSANVATSGFECSLDGTTAALFTAGVPYCETISNTMARHARTGLAQGVHQIRVRATDLAGNVSPAPTTYTETTRTQQGTYQYTVDLTAPVATINSGPPTGSKTNSNAATFTFSATDTFPTGENGTIKLECRRDTQAFADCGTGTGEINLTGLANGTHTFDVRPVDQAGNVGAVVTRSWEIGTGSVTLTQKPAAHSNVKSPTFQFESAIPDAEFECRQKNGTAFADISTGWADCSTGKGYTNLAEGTQWFEVRTKGATPGFPTVYTWNIDSVLPTVTISAGPGVAFGGNNLTNADTSSGTVTFTTNDAAPGSGALLIECSYDAGAWETCASPAPVNWTPVHDQVHTLQVRATDGAGNVSIVQSRNWKVDAQPPTPNVTWAGPAITSQLGNANSVNRFDYTSSEATRTPASGAFRCQFNTAAERDCAAASNNGQTGLLQTGTGNQSGPTQARVNPVQGINTLKVWAYDVAGNRSATPAEVSFVYDTQQPVVTAVAPETSIRTNKTTPPTLYSFTSNETVDRFECSYNSTTTYAKCSGSGTDVTSGTHQIAGPLAEGQHIVRVRGVDKATPPNTSTNNNIATYNLVVDLTAPVVTISAGPAADSTVKDSDATFRFAAGNEDNAVVPNSVQFECRVDGGAWENCAQANGNATAQKALEDLEDGEHTFEVRAKDAAGNQGGATSRTWTIDSTKPVTSITKKPAKFTNSTDASFEFEADQEDSTFECSLDPEDEDAAWWTQCDSPAETEHLEDGEHTVLVRATNKLGNRGEAASYTWTVDTIAPEVTIDSAPAELSNDAAPKFEFSSNEDDSTFECRLDSEDDADWAECDSPKAYSGLSEADHTFEVRATDQAGNTGEAASHEWTVDVTKPVVTITAGPTGSTTLKAATFGFSSNKAGSTFLCALDAGAFAACTSPRAISGLAAGAHTFRVQAKDAAGNVSAIATRSWTVTAPVDDPDPTPTPDPDPDPTPTPDPDPDPAQLGKVTLAKSTVTVARGGKAKFTVKLRNTGELTAKGVKVCPKISGKTLTGSACQTVNIAGGKTKTVTFTVKVAKKAKAGKKYTLEFRASGKGLTTRTVKATVKVR